MMTIELNKKLIKDIPVIICRNSNKNKKKLAIIYHAFLESKESMLPLSYFLAQIDVNCVLVDIKYHGERKYKQRKFPWKDFFFTVFDTAKEINKLIDHLILTEEVDDDDISVLGVSIGGMIAFAAALLDQRISNILTFLSGVNFKRLSRIRNVSVLRRYFTDNDMEGYNKNLKHVDELSEIYDPYLNLEKLYPKKIFMVNGTIDMAFPYKIIDDFQKNISHKYESNQEYLCFIKKKGVGHQLSVDMFQEAVHWLSNFIKVEN